MSRAREDEQQGRQVQDRQVQDTGLYYGFAYYPNYRGADYSRRRGLDAQFNVYGDKSLEIGEKGRLMNRQEEEKYIKNMVEQLMRFARLLSELKRKRPSA